MQATLCIAKLVLSKKVVNVTKNYTDANLTTASTGDVLEYTLTTRNTAQRLSVKHTTSEQIGDVLDYANMDRLNGATLSRDNVLTWPEAEIKAGDSLVQSFRVKVKDVIPATSTSVTDGGTFDLKMVNVYGNPTTVNLPCPVSLCIQTTVTKLPKTGGESSLVITFLLVCILGFFYARSKILAKEVEIVRYEYSRGV
jgi:hypothetical protein